MGDHVGQARPAWRCPRPSGSGWRRRPRRRSSPGRRGTVGCGAPVARRRPSRRRRTASPACGSCLRRRSEPRPRGAPSCGTRIDSPTPKMSTSCIIAFCTAGLDRRIEVLGGDADDGGVQGVHPLAGRVGERVGDGDQVSAGDPAHRRQLDVDVELVAGHDRAVLLEDFFGLQVGVVTDDHRIRTCGGCRTCPEST